MCPLVIWKDICDIALFGITGSVLFCFYFLTCSYYLLFMEKGDPYLGHRFYERYCMLDFVLFCT